MTKDNANKKKHVRYRLPISDKIDNRADMQESIRSFSDLDNFFSESGKNFS